MNCALIVAGIVANVALGCPPGAPGQWVPSDVAQIGDAYANGQFTRPPRAPDPAPIVIRDPLAELDALKAALVGKGVVTAKDVADAAKAKAASP